MPAQQLPFIQKTALVLFIIIAATAILYVGKGLLAPLAFGLVLAMLLIPMSRRLERWGVNRGLAAVICILTLVLAIALILGLLAWQLTNIASDFDQIKERLTEMVEQVQRYVRDHLGLGTTEQKKIIKKVESAGSPAALIMQTTSGFMSIAVNIVLVLVYIFLIMFFRTHLMKFLRKAVPSQQKGNVVDMMHEASEVSQKYLSGLALMIMSLWVLYGIGFSVIGVKYALFFAVLCGTLEIVPFVGNLTGTSVTVLLSIAQGADIKTVIGILLIYGTIQFVQSYVLEPVIVGREVDLNPFFTIVCIVIGEAIWGVAGMVLAIPIFGMIKIACDRFEPLKPYGFLLGCEKEEKGSSGLMEKIKSIFKK